MAAGLREFSGDRKAVLSSDKTWSVLLRSLTDENAKVVEYAAGAIAQVIGRYRRDLTAFDPLHELLGNEKRSVRMFAVRGLGHLDHPKRWSSLMPLLEDRAEAVRKEVILAIVHRLKEVPLADRACAKEILMRRPGGGGPELQAIIENAVRLL